MKSGTLAPPKRATPYGVDGQPVRPSFVDGLTTEEITELLGPMPAWRVRNWPPPGTATFADAVACVDRGELVELIDGILLEKDVGFRESEIALNVSTAAKIFFRKHNLGRVGGADGFLRLRPDQTRGPDTSILCWDRLPGGVMPTDPVPAVPPTIAVEILSASNTRQEMDRKLRDYFGAGTLRAWYVDPDRRTVRVYTSPTDYTTLSESAGDVLTGEDVLPGFELPLTELFTLPEPPGSPISQPPRVEEGPDAGQELLDGDGGQ